MSCLTLSVESGGPGAAQTAPDLPDNLDGGAEMADRICSVDGCERSAKAREVKQGGSYCAMHYSRLKRTGGLGPPGPVIHLIEGTLEEDLLAHREIVGSGCWRWTRRHHRSGYGLIGIGGFVHRVAYELWVGPVPEGLELDHVAARGCVHKDCFNPAHLEPVTHAENMRRTRGNPNYRKGRGAIA